MKCAVMFTDLAGYTRLSLESVPSAVRLIRSSRGIIQFCASFTKGVVKEEIADSSLLLFAKVQDAVDCSVMLLKEGRRHNREHPSEVEIRFCVGISWGEIVEEDDMLFGFAICEASKLGEDIAKEGDILLSKSALLMYPGDLTVQEERIESDLIPLYYRVTAKADRAF